MPASPPPKPLPLQTHTQAERGGKGGGIDRLEGWRAWGKIPTPSHWLTDTANKLSFKLMSPLFPVFSPSLLPYLLLLLALYFYTVLFHSPLLPISLSLSLFFLSMHQKKGSSEQSMRAVHQPEAQLAERHTTQSVWAATQRGCWRPTEVDTLYIQQQILGLTHFINHIHPVTAVNAVRWLLNINTKPSESTTTHQRFKLIFKIAQTGQSVLAHVPSPLPTLLSLNTLGAMLIKLSDKATAMFLVLFIGAGWSLSETTFGWVCIHVWFSLYWLPCLYVLTGDMLWTTTLLAVVVLLQFCLKGVCRRCNMHVCVTAVTEF